MPPYRYMPPSVLNQWTRLQLQRWSKAKFTDPPDRGWSITGGPTVGTSTSSEDYDSPPVFHVDRRAISSQGLKYVGGIDISYPKIPNGEAVAVLVVLEYPSLVLKHRIVRRLEATIPYIPPFLSEKELPPTLEIYDAALNTLPEAELPQVIFIDGHGQWHERQAGLATSFGVERDIPTIGIGKNYVPLRPDLGQYPSITDRPVPLPQWPDSDHWRGRQKRFRPVISTLLNDLGDGVLTPYYRGGPPIGAAVFTVPKPMVNIPSFISAGHKVSLGSAIALTMTNCYSDVALKTGLLIGTRTPHPLVLADAIGRTYVSRLWGARHDHSLPAEWGHKKHTKSLVPEVRAS